MSCSVCLLKSVRSSVLQVCVCLSGVNSLIVKQMFASAARC